MEDLLHIQGGVKEQREKAGKGDQLGQVGGHQPLDSEDGQRDERVAAAKLVQCERGQQNRRADERQDRLGRCPAHHRRPHQAVHE